MQGIFRKENTDKALKYGIYRHLPTYEKIIRNLVSFLISKILKIQFQDKSNPLNYLGILFSANQMIYLLIAMWIYPTLPDKMLMVIAMIFGAHLLPYSWLYNSKTYMVLSIIIPILSLIVGLNFANYTLAIMMILIEIIFSVLLSFENKRIVNDYVQ